MSKHQEWKMLHLLHTCARSRAPGEPPVLTMQELQDAGVHCEPDTLWPLEQAGVVQRRDDAYALTPAAAAMLRTFTVAKGPVGGIDLRVDYPEVFVVMPFGQPWSDAVFRDFFEPAIRQAGFAASRGDAIVRVGDLGTNVWHSITQAGLVVAEVSVPNPNVFYEIGLADALGKPVFVFKQKGAVLPADFGGVHYHEYELGDLAGARAALAAELGQWESRKEHRHFGVKVLVDR